MQRKRTFLHAFDPRPQGWSFRKGCRWLFERLLDFLYPRQCVLCHRMLTQRVGHFCYDCMFESLSLSKARCQCCGIETYDEVTSTFLCPMCQSHRPAFQRAFVILRYTPSVSQLIQDFKYRNRLWLIHDFTTLLYGTYIDQILGQGIEIHGIVSIPTTRAKYRRRGYNPSGELARALARKLHLPHHTKLLKRIPVTTSTQTKLNRHDRLANAKRIYHIRRPHDFTGKTLLLVDDVMTTGATMNACASLLKQQGATVYALVLARPTFG